MWLAVIRRHARMYDVACARKIRGFLFAVYYGAVFVCAFWVVR